MPARAQPSGKAPACCMNVNTPIDRPDLATYSQAEQFALGAQPSWNSPDITTNYVGQNKLMPEANVVVRNESATAARSAPTCSATFSRFGIGYDRTLFGTATTNFAPGEEKLCWFPLRGACRRATRCLPRPHRASDRPGADQQCRRADARRIRDRLQGRSIATTFVSVIPLPRPRVFRCKCWRRSPADPGDVLDRCFAVRPGSKSGNAKFRSTSKHGSSAVPAGYRPGGDVCRPRRRRSNHRWRDVLCGGSTHELAAALRPNRLAARTAGRLPGRCTAARRLLPVGHEQPPGVDGADICRLRHAGEPVPVVRHAPLHFGQRSSSACSSMR